MSDPNGPSDDLDEARRLIRRSIGRPEARLKLVVQTGPDEALAVGTADGYLRLALAALDLVRTAASGEAETLDLGGVTLATDPAAAGFGAVFAPGYVRLDGALLAASDADYARVLEHCREAWGDW